MKGREYYRVDFTLIYKGRRLLLGVLKLSLFGINMNLCIFFLLIINKPVEVLNTFKCNKKSTIYIETELFYCFFRMTENISKFYHAFKDSDLLVNAFIIFSVSWHSFRMRTLAFCKTIPFMCHTGILRHCRCCGSIFS